MNINKRVKKILFILILVLIIFFSFQIYKDIKIDRELKGYDTSDTYGPVQIAIKIDKIFYDKKNGKFYEIYPVAEYKIKAVVIEKQYINDRLVFSPLDISVVWWKMATKENLKWISSSLSNRALDFNIRSETIIPNEVVRLVANNHIIPADDNILEAFKNVKAFDNIQMEWYLVNVKEKKQTSKDKWETTLTAETSLSRTDTYFDKITKSDYIKGNCEIFYVNKIIHNGVEYIGKENTTLDINNKANCKNYTIDDLKFSIPDFKNNNEKIIFFWWTKQENIISWWYEYTYKDPSKWFLWDPNVLWYIKEWNDFYFRMKNACENLEIK